MIEKLERHTRVEKGLTQDIKISCPPEQSEMVSKINELIDAVNVLQAQVAILQEHAHPTATTEPAENGKCAKNAQDPYAEQRKWIGKLCWVWDDDSDERCFAKLTEIIEDDDDRPFKCFSRWQNCEPIKPDDDIIYKGGDNEL